MVGELERIADQVEHHLAQPAGVAADHRHQLVRAFQAQAQALGLGPHGHQRHHVAHGFDQGEIGQLQLHPPGLDLGQVQDVIDQRQQALARTADQLGVLALLRVELARQQQPVHAQHGVERGADLVAHGGQEARLGLAGRLGGGFGARQLALGRSDVAVDADDAVVGGAAFD